MVLWFYMVHSFNYCWPWEFDRKSNNWKFRKKKLFEIPCQDQSKLRCEICLALCKLFSAIDTLQIYCKYFLSQLARCTNFLTLYILLQMVNVIQRLVKSPLDSFASFWLSFFVVYWWKECLSYNLIDSNDL